MRTQFSMNQIVLLGNITNDPTIKKTENGTTIITFNLATNRSVKISDGKYDDKPTFHRIVCIGKGAEWLENKIKKGHKVLITGRQENRSYETESGEKKYISEIIAESVVPFLETKTSRKTEDAKAETTYENEFSAEDVAGDVPF